MIFTLKPGESQGVAFTPKSQKLSSPVFRQLGQVFSDQLCLCSRKERLRIHLSVKSAHSVRNACAVNIHELHKTSP